MHLGVLLLGGRYHDCLLQGALQLADVLSGHDYVASQATLIDFGHARERKYIYKSRPTQICPLVHAHICIL